jgi:hypothetical protein
MHHVDLNGDNETGNRMVITRVNAVLARSELLGTNSEETEVAEIGSLGVTRKQSQTLSRASSSPGVRSSVISPAKWGHRIPYTVVIPHPYQPTTQLNSTRPSQPTPLATFKLELIFTSSSHIHYDTSDDIRISIFNTNKFSASCNTHTHTLSPLVQLPFRITLLLIFLSTPPFARLSSLCSFRPLGARYKTNTATNT